MNVIFVNFKHQRQIDPIINNQALPPGNSINNQLHDSQNFNSQPHEPKKIDPVYGV